MTILCTIDLLTREVFLPADQRIASYDHNVDVIRFQAEPIEDFSLNTSSIRIAAKGPNKVRHDYPVNPATVSIEEETGYITFDWPIPAGVTEMPEDMFGYGATGQLIFAVCAEIISGSTLSKAWHSDDGIITVVAHLEPEAGGGEDPSETATNAQKIAQLQTDVAVINTQVGALANGSPKPARTVAEMTEHDKVYLYTGSETDYTAGNWYYWNGSAWTSGGTYGGAVTDTTLSISGSAADAKAVGDALEEKADSSDVTALETAVADKADADDVTSLGARVTALEGSTGRYLPADFIEALQGILSEAIYGTDQSDAIDALSDFSDGTHYFSVTKTLTHCASSNGATSIIEGGSYTTTISANDGYALTSVTCTMGGVSQTVTNGVISIAEVTGDIVITAVADVYEEGLLYRLQEETTFTGSNSVDTGVAIDGDYSTDNTLEFTIVCTTTCTGQGDNYLFSVYSTAQSGAGLYVDLNGSNIYSKWFTQSKNTAFSRISSDVLRIVFRKKSGEYPTVSISKNGDSESIKTLTFTATPSNAVIATGDHVIIGTSPSGAGTFKGVMSDLRIYDKAITDSAVSAYLGGE